MKYAKGITWIDDCRIPFKDENINFNTIQRGKLYGRNSYNESITEGNTPHYKPEGRFPPNLLVSDDMLNDGSVSKTNTKGQKRSEKRSWKYTSIDEYTTMDSINDKGSNSRYYDLDLWFKELLNKI